VIRRLRDISFNCGHPMTASHTTPPSTRSPELEHLPQFGHRPEANDPSWIAHLPISRARECAERTCRTAGAERRSPTAGDALRTAPMHVVTVCLSAVRGVLLEASDQGAEPAQVVRGPTALLWNVLHATVIRRLADRRDHGFVAASESVEDRFAGAVRVVGSLAIARRTRTVGRCHRQ
jgi:hypothetical protein